MSKGGGGETQQVVQKNEPWSGVQPYLKDLYKSASGIYGKPQQFFPHQTYALQSPLSNVGQQAALGYANNYLPSLVNAGTAGVGSMLNAADVGNNPYVNQMLGQQVSGMTNAFSQNADTITRNLTREWLPQIRSGAGLAGQYGSTRQGVAEGVALGEATRALGDYGSNAQQALGNSIAQTQLGAYGQGLDSQARALAFLPQQAQLGMMPSQIYGQVGGQQEQYNQQAINDAMQRFNFAQQEPYNRATWYNQILTGATPYASQSTTSSGAGGGSALGGALGGGMLGYSLAGPLAAMGGPVANGIASLGAPLAGTLGFGGAFAAPLVLGGALLGGLFN